jgi:hypothetical protein
MSKVESFISVIRNSFVGSQQVYTEGSCYHFYLILKEIFPTAECWYDQDHIITKIDDKFYDINGEIKPNTAMLKFDSLPTYSLKSPFNIYKLIK